MILALIAVLCLILLVEFVQTVEGHKLRGHNRSELKKEFVSNVREKKDIKQVNAEISAETESTSDSSSDSSDSESESFTVTGSSPDSVDLHGHTIGEMKKEIMAMVHSRKDLIRVDTEIPVESESSSDSSSGSSSFSDSAIEAEIINL